MGKDWGIHNRFVNSLPQYREFMDVLIDNEVIDEWEAPSIPSNVVYLNLKVTEGVYDEDEGKWTYPIDEFKTLQKMQKFMKLAPGKVEKEFHGTDFEAHVKIGEITVKAYISREAVCEKKVVEKKWIEPRVIEGHFEEVVEWDCHTPSILALDLSESDIAS